MTEGTCGLCGSDAKGLKRVVCANPDCKHAFDADRLEVRFEEGSRQYARVSPAPKTTAWRFVELH